MAFDKAKQAFEMRNTVSKMREIQKKLANEVITANAGGGAVIVEMTGEQKLRSIKVDPEKIDTANIHAFERLLEQAMTQAMNEAQRVAQDEMKAVTGDLGLPGF